MNRHKSPLFWGIHAKPPRWLFLILAIIPFLLALLVYLAASQIRHRDNPQDKLLPTASQLVNAVNRMAFHKDRRSENYLMFEDTKMSLIRLAIGVLLAALCGLLVGLNVGIFPGLSALLLSILTFFAMVPALAILPILFIVVGLDETSKVTLIFIGIFPLIARDMVFVVKKIPKQQITKALTLGASQWDITYRIVLPQIIPRLLESVRLSLGAAWLFLIAAEAISATEGLGYRVFLVRRYLAMDVIIPYVLWITFIGFCLDWLLRFSVSRFRWYRTEA